MQALPAQDCFKGYILLLFRTQCAFSGPCILLQHIHNAYILLGLHYSATLICDIGKMHVSFFTTWYTYQFYPRKFNHLISRIPLEIILATAIKIVIIVLMYPCMHLNDYSVVSVLAQYVSYKICTIQIIHFVY